MIIVIISSSRKLVTLLGRVLVLVDSDMLFERHVSDTCYVLETEVHVVSISHLVNLKNQIINNLFLRTRNKRFLTNSLSCVCIMVFDGLELKPNAMGRPLACGPGSLVTILPALRAGRLPVPGRAPLGLTPSACGPVPSLPPRAASPFGADALQGEEPG